MQPRGAGRKETRHPKVLPIRVYGMDARGKPFNLPATTINVSRSGLEVSGMDVQLRVRDIIGVQNGADKARYRVQWVSTDYKHLGLECIEPAKNIFAVQSDTGGPCRARNSRLNPPALRCSHPSNLSVEMHLALSATSGFKSLWRMRKARCGRTAATSASVDVMSRVFIQSLWAPNYRSTFTSSLPNS